MSTITLESVRPLAQSIEVERGVLKCRFVCPSTGTTVDSQAQWKKAPATLRDKIEGSAKKTLARSLQSSLGRSIRGFFCSGAIGKIAGDAAKMATKDALDGNAPTEEARNRALLEAFEQVADRFRWESASARWVAA